MTGRGKWRSDFSSIAILAVLLFFSFVPILMMLSMSLRDSLDIYGDFWGLPASPRWSNYGAAVKALVRPMWNSVYLSTLTIVGITFLSCLSAYVFARLRFLGKEMLFATITFLMTLPAVLQLTPNYMLADWLHLKNSLEGMALFYIGSEQMFAIFLLRAFFQSQPEELFESARMEGAGDWTCIWRIAVPLSYPILITLAILNFLFIYNDLIWPLLVISKPDLATMAMAIQQFVPNDTSGSGQISRPEVGIIAAGYMFSSIPLLLLFLFGMNYFVDGLSSGAIKS
ncbi:MAG: carbohydrate ABC transporter permease [Paenibacillaceae bacterium]|nr:carbohydrate ABC transporter permease [Paenibacillaceae bacterium]